ncbi:hypothetical protein IJT10_01390 [bacterium]|nr:hypothetical protein [bacterium]
MDPASQAFFNDLENKRLQIERNLINLPETSAVISQFQGKLNVDVTTLLHAIPITASLLCHFFYSARTCEKVSKSYASFGVNFPFDSNHTGYVLTCFAFAHLYRKVYKLTDSADFAKQFSTLLCLSCLNYSALQHIDWAVRSLAESRKPGDKNWLAPSILFTVWTTNIESPEKARAIAGTLEQVYAYTDNVWEKALQNQIFMQYPW